MILLGIGALLYGLKNSIKGDAKRANGGAKFAVGLAALGAVMFVWGLAAGSTGPSLGA